MQKNAKDGEKACPICLPFLLFLVTLLHSGEVFSAPDAEQHMYDQLQKEENRRQDRRLREMRVPGKEPKSLRGSKGQKQAGPCFTIHQIDLRTPAGKAPPFPAWLWAPLTRFRGQCLNAEDIKTLQKRLSNRLINHGYVTSRVLLPEQDLSGGVLKILIIPGRIESLDNGSLPKRTLDWAFPATPGDLLNLRDMEQAIENLSRLPGLDPNLDLRPGSKQGGTVVVSKSSWPKHYRADMLLNERYYGTTTHGTGRLGVDWGSPFNIDDRLSVALTGDLDQKVNDRAFGGNLDYDVSKGYWNLDVAWSRQQYDNTLKSAYQKLDSSGDTEISHLELTRVLKRTGTTRVSLAAVGAYSHVENRLENTIIGVSSYRLRTGGLRLGAKYLGKGTQVAGTMAIKRSMAAGPATALPTGTSVGDIHHTRYQAYITGSHFFKTIYSTLKLKINAQYSADRLFPSEQRSIASETGVRGYEDLSVNGNSAATGTLQIDTYPPITGPLSVQPFVAYDRGFVPGDDNENGFVRLDSAAAGIKLGYDGFRLKTETAWPIAEWSTRKSQNEYTIHASLYLQI